MHLHKISAVKGHKNKEGGTTLVSKDGMKYHIGYLFVKYRKQDRTNQG